MSGHDSKRGYIQHLLVMKNKRNCGIAKELLKRCLQALEVEGIMKSHIFILRDNEIAKHYWSNQGWEKRNDIDVFSYIKGTNKNI